MADEPRLSAQVGTRLLHEDERTRVWLLELAPGEATDWHAHACDYAFVVTRPGRVDCEYVDGTVEHQVGALGDVELRTRDVPHRLVNVGETPYENVVVELKASAPEA